MNQTRFQTRNARDGLTLIEFVVVISIIAVLLAMLLPALMSVRESSRNLSCANRLKQISMATQSHVSAHRHFPAVGWGSNWIGLRDRGFGLSQPGGWLFNILPFIEASSMHELAISEQEARSLVGLDRIERYSTIIHLAFVCPGKPDPNNSYKTEGPAWHGQAFGGHPSSYAINAGSNTIGGELVGPVDLDFKDFAALWPSKTSPPNGIASPGRLIFPRDVVDGLSNTLLAGEKYVQRERRNYVGDTLSPWFGFSLSSVRYVAIKPFRDNDPHGDPQSFGSSHLSHFNVTMADGSVHALQFEIAESVLLNLGMRNDGNVISREDF